MAFPGCLFDHFYAAQLLFSNTIITNCYKVQYICGTYLFIRISSPKMPHFAEPIFTDRSIVLKFVKLIFAESEHSFKFPS